MTEYIVYQKGKIATQSGKAYTQKWIVEAKVSHNKYIEPLMGWLASSGTQNQVVMCFDSKEQAIDYLNKRKLKYELKSELATTPKIKNYANNFTKPLI